MVSLKDKLVLITGASSGIGKATAYAFADNGANLILTARREKHLSEIANDIREKYKVEVKALKLDVRSYDAVKETIHSLPEDWKDIDILVNNAGLGRGKNKIHEDNVEGWEEMIDTNIKGLLYVTREVVPMMVERKKGHVINLGSIAGREAYIGGGVYCASKHAVTAITRTLRMELLDKKIRVSTVDPGSVETEFSLVRYYGDEEKAKELYQGIEPLVAEDIADAIIFCANRPPHANIAEMVIFPTAQATATMHYRGE
jgi:NADP-dependent 3-hydroxy acid dehydrogenase YdfG